jgi:hypothetical protein
MVGEELGIFNLPLTDGLAYDQWRISKHIQLFTMSTAAWSPVTHGSYSATLFEQSNFSFTAMGMWAPGGETRTAPTPPLSPSFFVLVFVFRSWGWKEFWESAQLVLTDQLPKCPCLG